MPGVGPVLRADLRSAPAMITRSEPFDQERNESSERADITLRFMEEKIAKLLFD